MTFSDDVNRESSNPMQTDEIKTKVWKMVCKSNPKDLKRVSYGARKFLAIDAYPQIKKATEIFGPFGIGFGLNNSKYTIIDDIPKMKGGDLVMVKMLIFETEFWYRFPESNTVGVLEMINDIEVSSGGDFCKKVMTDTITKALSYLGFNYDVFAGKFDDNRYDDRLDTPAEQWMKDNLMTLLDHPVIGEERKAKVIDFQVKAGWTAKSVSNSINGAKDAIKKAGEAIPELKSDPSDD